MLDLKALKKALTVIGNVGKGELTFYIDDTPVTLRVLTADEDLAVQRYARDAEDEEGKNEEAEALTILERFKRATLSYSIVQVGDTDLRDVDFIATDEVTDKGAQVKLSKPLAVRKIVDGWSRTATLALFQKYLELARRVDVEAEKSVKFNPQDLEAEISRVDTRLAELKREKERADSLRQGSTSQLESVLSADQAAAAYQKTIAAHAGGRVPVTPEVPAEDSPPEVPVAAPVVSAPAPEAPQERKRVVPTASVAAPPPRPVEHPVSAPPQAPPVERNFETMVDSLGDGPDEIAAETARIQEARAAMRRSSMESLRSNAAEVIPASPSHRTPPHRAAANAADAVLDTDAGSIEAARATGPVDGVDTYRLPPASLSNRGRAPLGGAPPLDPKPKSGPTNPRFKPPAR